MTQKVCQVRSNLQQVFVLCHFCTGMGGSRRNESINSPKFLTVTYSSLQLTLNTFAMEMLNSKEKEETSFYTLATMINDSANGFCHTRASQPAKKCFSI